MSDIPLDDEVIHCTWPINGPLGKLCECSICGIVRRCCAGFDFYCKIDDPEKKLFCEPCLLKASDCEDLIYLDSETSGEEDNGGEDPADWWKND